MRGLLLGLFTVLLLPGWGEPTMSDYIGAYVESPTWRVIRGSGNSSAYMMLPCVRQIIGPASEYSASVRLCIHLKPLRFTK